MVVNRQKGQSLVEVIFSIGILVLVIAAVIDLVVKTTGIKSMELQRKKASDMSEVVVENLLEEEKNNPSAFWQLVDIGRTTIADYDGYSYTVDFDWNKDGGCSDIEKECANAVITINWGDGDGQTFTVERFFSNKF